MGSNIHTSPHYYTLNILNFYAFANTCYKQYHVSFTYMYVPFSDLSHKSIIQRRGASVAGGSINNVENREQRTENKRSSHEVKGNCLFNHAL